MASTGPAAAVRSSRSIDLSNPGTLLIPWTSPNRLRTRVRIPS